MGVPMKTAKLDPLKPSRADYRLIRKILDSSFSGKVLHTERGYDLIVRVFQRAGGSWEKLFLGSSNDISLLKRILKVAFKKGYLPRAPDWR
jgi:hypothetical protein